MADEPLLSVSGLGCRFGPRVAVDNVNLDVRRGAVLGLLGLNGAGKTTTLRMLSGVLAPSHGEIHVAGVDLMEAPRRAKERLGYLPESPPLQEDATVRDFLAWAAALRRVPRRRRAGAVDRALQRCALEAVAGRLIRNLSRGYQQRVGIAQALVHEPPLIILDEPTVSLDPAQVHDLRALVEALRGEHAVVLSSHILSEVQAMCSHVTVLHHGRQIHSAPVAAPERAGRYRLVLTEGPGAGALEAVPGVEAVHAGAHGRWEIEVAEPAALDALVHAAVEQGWRLRELSPQPQTLEQVFLGLTRDGAEAAA